MLAMEKIIKDLLEFSDKYKFEKGFPVKTFKEFLRIFYLQNKERDFGEYYSPKEMLEYALLSFKIFVEKKPQELKVTINDISEPQEQESEYNPSLVIINITNDDKPFLVDSIIAYFDKTSTGIKNIMHPILHTIRDVDGKLLEITEKKGAVQESVIQIHLENGYPRQNMEKLKQEITQIVENVNLVVNDWQLMTEFANDAAKQISKAKNLNKKASEIDEAKEFMSWITKGNFIFLGSIEFEIKEVKAGEYQLQEVKKSALGVFRSQYEAFRPIVKNTSIKEVCESVKNPFVIEVIKSRYKSSIHRDTSAERIRVQKISEDGKVIGEYRFIGLFTSSAYYNYSASSIPLVKGKIADVIEQSGYVKGSHNYKDLVSVLESYPRDELFQIDTQDLLRISTGIVSICGRSQVRFFARKDKYNRFVSCLIFMPRDRSNSDARDKVKSYLSEVYQGFVADSFVQVTESKLTRFHVIIRTDNGIAKVNEHEVEATITKMLKIWNDDLKESIKIKFGQNDCDNIFAKYKNAFSVSYTNRFSAIRAAIDISLIEKCINEKETVFYIHKSENFHLNNLSELKIYSEKELQLSEMMPILESFGFNMIQEYTYCVTPGEFSGDKKYETKVYIHYFQLNFCKTKTFFSDKSKNNFEKLLSLIWKGIATKTPLNRLIPMAELTWKQVYMFTAYTQYLYQAGFRYSQETIAESLAKYSDIAELLGNFFEIKFNDSEEVKTQERDNLIKLYCSKIEDKLALITDINSDVIIRRFFNIIKATTRTNYFQNNAKGGFKEYLSFKFDCSKIIDLPLPVPFAEIFVYSAKVEGVHLRGGKVARGGLRWSDRHEDFRTEVLGLVKAQMTKNAVIVPVGSKGGFVVKKSIDGITRAEYNQEAVECYKTFLRGILDITDNVVNGEITNADCVAFDGSDPYLVVAADKGTATFSDIANSISAEYNFWLGDAFASGGSYGYDHKKMGITAKGGWVSVMRHFREMGIDTQTQDFTCVGIGDLAGDVFGNGMLLSKHIKLVAAFNHLHIFLDPNPDAAASYEERVRMFNLTGSSWLDYDMSKISQGGGIFERTAKVIPISAEVKQLLDIEEDELTPKALIKKILKAKVDLLWNGGIGTYVKASDETDNDVGDRANNELRINGNELRCKVVGEGGNLGFTQKGRIEFAINGGRINTDAMDNSAGVDCSDHEVNIKIALAESLANKKITLEERNKILEQMTENVSELVLNDNKLQTQAISIALSQGVLASQERSQFLNRLENTGLLNRKIEFLPSKQEIERRQMNKIGFTRPELCVMLAYAKMDIYNSILTSDFINDEYFESELMAYFPKLMQEKFANEIKNHQLRKEIIATQITNLVVNRAGITFVSQICQDSGFSISDVVKNFIIACDSFRLREIWSEIEQTTGKVSPEIQCQMFLNSNKLLERSIMWLLRQQVKGPIAKNVDRFKKISDKLLGILDKVLASASQESFERKIERYCLNKVERNLATKIASMDPLASAFDIAEISAESKFDIEIIAKLYFAVGTRFSLKWLRSKISSISFENQWQRLSSKTILEDIYTYQLKISKAIVDSNCNNKEICENQSIENWTKSASFLIERFDNFISELKLNPNPDISVFVVALNRLKPLVS